MRLFVTADLHLNHKNIIDYCNRPFNSVEHMNTRLIANINSRCKSDDFLWHLGDLIYAKSNQAEALLKFKDVLNEIKPHLYMIRGNHDQNNGGKNLMLYTVFIFANKKYLFTHIPPSSPGYVGKYIISEGLIHDVDCILCGHVHGAWKHKFYDGKLIINVGVDVWNYMPVKMDEIDIYFNRIKRGK